MIRRESCCSVLCANTCATHTCGYSVIAQNLQIKYMCNNKFQTILRSNDVIIEKILDLLRFRICMFYLLCLFPGNHRIYAHPHTHALTLNGMAIALGD